VVSRGITSNVAAAVHLAAAGQADRPVCADETLAELPFIGDQVSRAGESHPRALAEPRLTEKETA
jgi:hypothetical protein